MARILKNYHERKDEFLDTAQQLFFTQGYDQTSVDAIIRKIGLSKGTFYYYFKSKEDLLDQLTCKMGEKILEEVKKIADRKDLDAIDKLNEAYAVTGNVKLENLELLKVLIKVLYNDRNLFFRYKIYRKFTEMLAPEFAKIIWQGMNEKLFNTSYPDEAARLIFEIANVFSGRIPRLIIDLDKFPENLNKMEREFKVYENAIERIIGAREGTFNIVNRNTLKIFSEKLKN
ncbi:MAG: TetR/AcrR family transcriptional regulator [Candidatus Atribacteria bacterium]|nr:TetR/AcrR family transcriptional regulator [Candidatus Atribacteria bacterium]